MSESIMKQVNVAVQVLPSSRSADPYSIVDEAIAIIHNSGIPYRITPFETVMEGEYDRLMEIVKQVQLACYKAGADSIMCYVKIQSNMSADVTISDKMGKYDL